MSAPTLSVIVPSYRRVDRLPALVDEYLEQGADQVVVVLDGPHPGWRAVLSTDDPRVVVTELTENRGLALARIAGLDLATGDVVVIADDDVEPLPGLIERHRAFHAGHDDHVLLGYMPVVAGEGDAADDAPSRLYARGYDAQVAVWRRGDSETILRSLWGGNVSLPRELYQRAEDARPSVRLEYNEDLDLGVRLLGVGAVGAFDESAAARHHHHRGLAHFSRESVVRGEAIAALEARWGTVPAQLRPLIDIAPSYNRVAAAVQRRIGERDAPGALEAVITASYRLCGVLRAYRAQDALTRLVRRGLVRRGYRRARAASA